MDLDETERAEVQARLAEWEAEHRALDLAIDAMAAQSTVDALAMRRLKKRKLAIKDAIERLRSRAIPDLNA
ncbi:MAG: YdcH family protein [Thioalkalivibrionaceae bacterium]